MKKRQGFTLIEVAFFIAITGALFIGIIAGTQNSIWQQKYNDAVQSYTNFLRNVYAEVANTQGIYDGRSDKAIYGKLISFGQEYDLNGEPVANSNVDQKVFVYDVIGDASGGGTGTINETLADLRANVLKEQRDDFGNVTGVTVAGIVGSYVPIWGAVIENDAIGSGAGLYTGTILVVRHPKSGMINTLVSPDIIDINLDLKNADMDKNFNGVAGILTDKLPSFKIQQVDFCLNPYGVGRTGSLRRDIRIAENARNASGVEIMDLVNNPEINKCASK